MSLNAYKKNFKNPEIKESYTFHGLLCENQIAPEKRIDNNFKSNKFFYMVGLIIFLYGGLKVLDYSDRYKVEANLLQQAMHKLLTPFVPQLLTAKESVKTVDKAKKLTKDANTVNEKKVLINDEQIFTKNDNVVSDGSDVKTDGVKKESDDKEQFFDPLGITSESEVLLLESLGVRRMQLEERDKVISKRELELEVFEKKLTEKWSALQIIQEEVKRQLAQLDKGETAKEQSLSKVYENMKPKDAARIFDSLDLSVVLQIISHMKEKKLSEIMGFVSTERARDITQGMAFKTQSLAKTSTEEK
jgi:flagellar motility protein MotE (MotC chaperone)